MRRACQPERKLLPAKLDDDTGDVVMFVLVGEGYFELEHAVFSVRASTMQDYANHLECIRTGSEAVPAPQSRRAF